MTDQIIGIDGPAGSGKSTVARAVAERLGWTYLDTGAMYRAVTVLAMRVGVDLADEAAVLALAATADIALRPVVVLNGEDVSVALRTPETNEGVSIVASLPLVRAAMVERQRAMAAAESHGVVVEGRDITTVVFPEAPTKIFLTASLEERAKRRGDETSASIARRDQADESREASPLRQAADAHVIDTTGLTITEVVEEIVRCHTNTSSN
jgi:cytidylate kinase